VPASFLWFAPRWVAAGFHVRQAARGLRSSCTLGRRLSRCVFGAFVLVSQGAWAQTDVPSPPPAVVDATITLTARSAGIGVGFIWGAGTLDYQGQRYPVRVDGMGIGAVGVSAVTARGVVYYLKEVDDLNGQYSGVGAGLEVGRGANRLRMRNAKGVVIEFAAAGEGIQLGAGPRGVTLQVGAAGGAPAAAGFVLPKTLGFGQAAFGPLSLQPTLNVQLAGFAEGNAGFGGEWAVGPLNQSDVSMQHSNEVGVNALVDLAQYGTVRGRVSGIFTLSGGGVDPGATSYPDFNTSSYSIEAAFLSWQSGNAFPGSRLQRPRNRVRQPKLSSVRRAAVLGRGLDCGVRAPAGCRRAKRSARPVPCG